MSAEMPRATAYDVSSIPRQNSLTPRVASISGRIGTMMMSWLLAENIISQSAARIQVGWPFNARASVADGLPVAPADGSVSVSAGSDGDKSCAWAREVASDAADAASDESRVEESDEEGGGTGAEA